MARTARAVSSSGFYHVMARGVGRQIIFEDDDDRTTFALALRDGRTRHGVEVLAGCLMSNHVHILLMGQLPDVSACMQGLQAGYATAFNHRHDRTGALFQGRYTSVPIETDEQLCAVARYIHLNPVKAGGSIEDRWSSYREYLGRSGAFKPETDVLLEMLGGREGFVRFHAQGGVDDVDVVQVPRLRVADEDVLEVARRVLGNVSPYDVRAMERGKRNEVLAMLRGAGLSIRQTARLTSIGRGIIQQVEPRKM